MARNHILPHEIKFVKAVMGGMSQAEAWTTYIYPLSDQATGTHNANKNGDFLFNRKPSVVAYKEKLLRKLDEETTDIVGGLVAQLDSLERLAEKAESEGQYAPAVTARKDLVRFREASNMRKMNELEALAKLAERSNLPREVVEKMAADISSGPKL